MKLLHCGDLHLDSPLNANLDGEKKKQRKGELLSTFVRLAEYGAEQEARVILIAGDLFDRRHVTKRTQNMVKETILRFPSMDFLYVKGNHDEENFLEDWEERPDNLKLFGDDWTYYRYGDTVIAGAEFREDNGAALYDSLVLNRNDCNIVVLHGQTEKYRSADKAETVVLSALKNKNIDYLALGHIHFYKSEPLDSRGVYCYCGCPEGRGFDECGEKGFVWLEAEDGKVTHTFVPFACRTVHEVFPDISGAETTLSVEQKVAEALAGIPETDLVKVSLVGKVGLSAERDLQYLTTRFESRFFTFKINDKAVGIAVRPEEYENDISLRGEFIRTVMAGNYTEEEKRMLLELGIRALNGEEAESCF
jgi:DNA repair exonuclease SbcCD nuclease subunit